MKITDAVFTAATFLQLDGITSGFEAKGFDPSAPERTLSEEDARELTLLVRCCNLVIGELATAVFPLKKTKAVTCKDGKIAYTAIDENVLDVYTVEQDGARVPFDAFFDCIMVPVRGTCTVTYSVAPIAAKLDGQSPFAGNKPSARLIAYGIAREYCLICGRTEEATTWDGRFLAAVEEESRKKGELRVRPRAWR